MKIMKSITHPFRRYLARQLLEKGIEAELGIVKDTDAARRNYRRAAILGNRQAQVFLAYYYASNPCRRSNRRLALAWFRRAINAGEKLCELVSMSEDLDHDEKNSVAVQIKQFERLLSL